MSSVSLLAELRAVSLGNGCYSNSNKTQHCHVDLVKFLYKFKDMLRNTCITSTLRCKDIAVRTHRDIHLSSIL
jgi:hypothetical protein